MVAPSVSVIISVYNKMHWLEMVLAGFEEQSFNDFEVVIADDGSKQEFREELERYCKGSSLKVQHVWHEDKGFRKTRILNKAVQKAKGEYLVFIDGDCIPARNFVGDHWFNRAPDIILAGRRANLSPGMTQSLTPEKIRNGELGKFSFYQRLWGDSLKKETKHVEKSIRLPRFIYKLLPSKSKGIVGCNFSVNKQDLLEINGFDMRYEAPEAGEDTDIEHRLRWKGKKIKYLKYQAIQFHLYHKRLQRESENLKILARVIESKNPVTPLGINEL